MLDFIKELMSSVRKTSTERISNPFYGVFILTWISFNWESVSIFIFSDLPMQERVRFINSAYPPMILYPFIFSVVLTFVLPWCTEKVTFFQSKSLNRTSTLLAVRKKKMLTADISVERFRAKKDVAYERYRVGADKEVQLMRESIADSAERTGTLTASLDEALSEISVLKPLVAENHNISSKLKEATIEIERKQVEFRKLMDSADEIRKNFELVKVENHAYLLDNERMKFSIEKISNELPGLFSTNDDRTGIYIREQAVNDLSSLNVNKEVEYLNQSVGKVSTSMTDTMTVYPQAEDEMKKLR